MKEIIEKALGYFEIIQRGDNSIVVLKITAPQTLRDSVMAAHGDKFPNDWVYNKYHSILDAFLQYRIETDDDLEDKRSEIADSLVDAYTSDLTAWLNSYNSNVYYLTEAQEEYGPDGFRLLAMAQSKAIDEIANEVIKYLIAEKNEEKKDEEGDGK